MITAVYQQMIDYCCCHSTRLVRAPSSAGQTPTASRIEAWSVAQSDSGRPSPPLDAVGVVLQVRVVPHPDLQVLFDDTTIKSITEVRPRVSGYCAHWWTLL